MKRLSLEAKRESFARMCRTFEHTTLADAKRGTDTMHAWENHPRPDQHVNIVARLARSGREEKTQKFDEKGNPIASCFRCGDTGLASVYVGCLPRTRERYLALYGEREQTFFLTTTIACLCESVATPNQWLKDHDDVMVYCRESPADWIRKNDQEKYDRVMYGLAVAQTWATKPEEF